MFVNLGDGYDSLDGFGELLGTQTVVGAQGINLNAGWEPNAPDSDVSFTGVEHVAVVGDQGVDRISGHGGAGTVAPDDK
jgi:hypothetical protein